MLGTIPRSIWAPNGMGPRGVLAGEALGSMLFGLLAMVGAFVLVRRLERQQHYAWPLSRPESLAWQP